jgi:L-alanine-DL-glutamate epimerase-like enolase superfamily enzyme
VSDRIASVEALTTVVPLPRPLRLGPMTVTRREYVAVRVTTADGVVGKAYALTREAPMAALVERLVAPHVVGRDAADLDGAWAAAFRGASIVGRVGLGVRALGLVDVALWDIAAQRAGVPVWQLLGGGAGAARAVDTMLVAVYATPGRDAADLAGELLGHAADGWPLLKIARSPDRALMRDLLARAAGALGERLVVDVGFGWPDADSALAELAAWDAPPLAWLEDPLLPEDAAGCARVRADGGQRVGAGDEVTDPRTVADLVAGAVDVLRLDVIAIGGITAARREVARAAAAGVPVSFHVSPEVSLHLAIAGPATTTIETFDRRPPEGNPYDPAPLLIADGPRFADGRAVAANAPGLGFDLDWERFGA